MWLVWGFGKRQSRSGLSVMQSASIRLEVVDEMIGEIKKTEVFVAVLLFSHYVYLPSS